MLIINTGRIASVELRGRLIWLAWSGEPSPLTWTSDLQLQLQLSSPLRAPLVDGALQHNQQLRIPCHVKAIYKCQPWHQPPQTALRNKHLLSQVRFCHYTSSTFSSSSLESNVYLAFADQLQQQLSSSTASSGTLAITDDALRTLDGHLEQLPLYRTDLPISTRHQLDLKGTEVWNTCMQLMATCGEDAERGLLSKGI